MACLSVAPAAASAADWSLRSTASETVEFNTNPFLAVPPSSAVSSYSTATANAEARTTTSKFDFDSYVNYRNYWGPAAQGLPQTDSLAYGFTAHYETFGKNNSDRNFIEGSYTSQSSAFALLNQLGVLSPTNGTLEQAIVRGGIDRVLSARDTVSFSAQSVHTFYDPVGGGTSFTDTLGSGSWQHRLNTTFALTASSQAEWLNYENALGSNIIILRNQGGLDAQLTQLISFRGSAGAAYVKTENGINTLTSSVGNTALSSSSVGFIGDALLTYKALKTTTFTFGASQTIGPSIVGSLYQLSTANIGMAYTINTHSSISLNGDISRSVLTNTTDFASASISYNHELTRDWSAQLSYRHLHRFGSSGTATLDPITGTPILSGQGPADSDSITVVITRSATILPHSN